MGTGCGGGGSRGGGRACPSRPGRRRRPASRPCGRIRLVLLLLFPYLCLRLAWFRLGRGSRRGGGRYRGGW
uniref:Uncharacterized protein n=1 Tax=Arundo donax TaxID=35708 RepID=A0A0A9H767_ARUDO